MARPKGMERSLSADALRRAIGREEFDYVTLVDALKGYARPRAKVTALLRQNAIIRVKKGLYVFGPEIRRRPFSPELLANTIYGPSYVSMEYALAHYGLIPEQVNEVTCASLGRNKRFNTPVGRFSYQAIPERAFWIGVDRLELEHGAACLMATREKALADVIHLARRTNLNSLREMKTYLVSSLRIEEEPLSELDKGRMNAIAKSYGSRRVSRLAKVLSMIRQEAAHE